MASPTILIKNMVCQRCILAVENILISEHILFQKIAISQVTLCAALSADQRRRIANRFIQIGFELTDNRHTALIEKIKLLVATRARNELNGNDNENDKKQKLSHYIAGKVNHEYSYLSSLFSSVEGTTIEKYFIAQRIEKVKQLLICNQLTLSQIAFELDYSSVAHLSGQFKSVTGCTPTFFKENWHNEAGISG